jgi:hypothetical protein
MDRGKVEFSMSPIKIILGCVLFDTLQLIVWIVRMEATSFHIATKAIEAKGDQHEHDDSSENFDSGPWSGARTIHGGPLSSADRSGT